MKKNSRPTQCQRIIQYMHDFGSITSMQAMADLGVYRLASRISELKDDGWDIVKKTIKQLNRYGEPVRFAQYSLAVYDGEEKTA